MAVTKTHPVKSTLKAAIDYICNPEKTDGKLLVSSYGCAAETADIEFAWTRRHAIDKGTNLGRHLIQAFQPGEVTPEQAHEIGMELAREILGGRYEFVLTTHIDRNHVHNHLIFNAVSFADHKHYHSNKRSYENDLPTTSKRPTDPYKWATKTVVHILERLDYLGHTVNFKTSKQSFKSKKVLWNDPADWVIFENTQEPIIEESVFLIVQKIRQGRRRPTKMGDMGMFSGLLFCADCGGKMYLCRANHFKPEQEYYLCSTYRKDRTLCSTHSIRRVVLEEIVLRNLREAIQYVTQYEDDFVRRAADQSLRERDKELAQKKDTLAQSQKRIAELDVIIKRLYEDNISGKLSDERFIKLSRDYELEQTNLTNLVEHLRQEVKEQEKQKVNVRQFIAAVRKYTDMQQLDASILREFVDKIYISEVYTPDENEPHIKVREIEIVYNFIGAFDFEEARDQSQAAQKEKRTGVA